MPERPSAAERQAQGRSLADAGRTAEAIAYLRASAVDLAEEDPAGAATLLVDAVQPTMLLSGPQAALDVAREAVEIARGTVGIAELRALTRLGDAHAWAGHYADAQAAWGRAAALDPGKEPSALCDRANALLRRGELDAARTAAYEAIVRSRQAESRVDLLDALAIACTAEVHLGNLREALDCAEQQLAATEGETGLDRGDALASLAWVSALLGDVDQTEAALARARVQSMDLRMTVSGGLAAGMLALGRGRFGEAVDAFETKIAGTPMSPLAQALSLRPFVPDLVEAYAHAGRTDDARALIDQFFEAALETDQARVVAPALRARGTAYDDEVAFDEAIRWHRGWGNRFEEGRTLLARGEMLRRRKQRAAARRDLAAAVQRFTQVASVTWGDRAAAELRAAGDRSAALPAPITRGPEALSQQEAAIVKLVAEGLSNSEIAARLFLSVKTVEGHLTAVYGKLGIRSRSQLLAALLDAGRDGARQV